MAQSIAKLVIDLEANFAKFTSQFDQLQTKVNRGTAAITSSLKKIAAFSLAGLSVNKLVSELKTVGDEAKSLSKISLRFNIDPTQFSAMQYAAQKAGVEVEIFNRSIQFMAKNISNAALGIEEMIVTEDGLLETSNKSAQALQELGINIQAIAKAPLDVQLKAIIGSLYSMEDETRRVAVALDIFGKSGGKMAIMGAEGLAVYIANMEKAQQTGKAWSNEQIKDALEAQKAISAMKDSWEGLRRELVLLAHPLSQIFDLITAIIQQFMQARSAVNKFGDALMDAAAGVSAVHGFELGGAKAEGAKEGGLPPDVEKRLRGILAAGQRMREMQEQYPELFGEKGRPGKTKGGGGAAGPDPFEQLAKTLEGLETDKLSLIGTEFQKIDDWVLKTMKDINQWGDLGELTAKAVATAWELSSLKRQEVEKDFGKWFAEQQGDITAIIGYQIDELVKKWKDVPGAMAAIRSFGLKEIAKKEGDYAQSRLNLTKQFLDELTNTAPLLSEQLRLKEQTLAIDIQIGRERLKLLQFEPWMTDELWKQSNALAAQVEKAKELALAREKLMTQGAWGGMQAWALTRQVEAEQRPAKMMIDTMQALEQEIGAGMAAAFIGLLRGKQTDFSEIAFSMAESFARRAFEGLTATAFDAIAKMLGTTLAQQFPMVTAATTTAGILNTAGMTLAQQMISGATMAAGILAGSGGGGGGSFLGGGFWGSIFGGGGGGGFETGFEGWDFFNGMGFTGFQRGGSFTVPGAGGPDSRMVAFRATPGEQVTVTPPGESGGRININVHQTFVTQDPASFKASRTQLAAQAATDLQRSMRNL